METSKDFVALRRRPHPCGAYCDKAGAFVDNVPLLRKERDRSGRLMWVARRFPALDRDLTFGYGLPIDTTPLTGRLDLVAAALNKGNLVAAQAALAKLRLPALPKRVDGRLDDLAQARLVDALRKISLLRERSVRDFWKFDPDEPRIPAGNGRESGRWTNEEIVPASFLSDLLGGRRYRVIHGVPANAVAVIPPDGRPIEDPSSPTQVLMAPPHADFRQVYAAGQLVAPLPEGAQLTAAYNAVGHEGTYDFQRIPSQRIIYADYVNASNYAVGVFMAGAGFSMAATVNFAEFYAFVGSSNYGSRQQIQWIKNGWTDATFGRWK